MKREKINIFNNPTNDYVFLIAFFIIKTTETKVEKLIKISTVK